MAQNKNPLWKTAKNYDLPVHFREDALVKLAELKEPEVLEECKKLLKTGCEDDWLTAGWVLRHVEDETASQMLLDEIYNLTIARKKKGEDGQDPWAIPFINWVGEILPASKIELFETILTDLDRSYTCHLTSYKWSPSGRLALQNVQSQSHEYTVSEQPQEERVTPPSSERVRMEPW